MTNVKDKVVRLAQMAVLAALIVILQQFSIPLGANSLCLVLVPLVMGAILHGPLAGAVLGGVFGAVITWLAVEGRLGVLTTMMLSESAVLTIAICMGKGIAAGWVAGLIAKALKNKPMLGTLLASAAAPVVNTGIYFLGITTVFRDTALRWAAQDPNVAYTGGSILYLAIFILIGLNFVIELSANVVLAPAIRTVVNAVRKMR